MLFALIPVFRFLHLTAMPRPAMSELRSTPSHGLFRWMTLLLPPLLWAGNFIVGRAVHGTMTPMALSLGRWVVVVLCLLPLALRIVIRDRARYWAYRWRIVATSATGMMAFTVLVYVGLRTTTASNALLLNSLIPLLIVLLGAMFFRQRLSLNQAVGLIVSFAGVATLILHGQWSQWRSIHFVPGDALVLIAMVAFALYTLWLRALPADLDRRGLMLAQSVVAVILILPLWGVEHASGQHPIWNWQAFAALLYLGIFPSVLGYLLYMRAIHFFGAARAGLSIHLIPVFGVILSSLLLHEHLHAWHAVGIAAIAAGLVCANLKVNKMRTMTLAKS